MENTTFKPRRASFLFGASPRIRASAPSFVSGNKAITLKPRENAPVMGCGQYSDCSHGCGHACAGSCGIGCNNGCGSYNTSKSSCYS